MATERRESLETELPDRYIFTRSWAYLCRATRARHALRGIDERIAKAERASAGKTAVKRDRFVKLNGTLKDKTRA